MLFLSYQESDAKDVIYLVLHFVKRVRREKYQYLFALAANSTSSTNALLLLIVDAGIWSI